MPTEFESKITRVIKLSHERFSETTMIIPSAWNGYFHVITENYDEGNHYHTHDFLSTGEVIHMFEALTDKLNDIVSDP